MRRITALGTESPRGVPKSPNNVTSTFFNTVNLLQKELRFEHGGGHLTCFLPLEPSNLVIPLTETVTGRSRAVRRFHFGDGGRKCFMRKNVYF